eukprot:CAMPEP_0177311664 /NCGR_PEP_ID=MMETSP0368-20130122/10477_1 /TAXON_ID=447022 ORGANISM="Scrippsiella hangoei-like, Strain SHHI-4" /NCGR_SAMPLE_ID=MMETSP0368 /ASSEMBLY_ACC=CAM_ASM_000363 /LENGTH=286 /DNA_ID=CAMNT_0018770673 /DNA_START=23 /DNA_END=879 /DNA_ORIENTATION=+
MSVFHGLGLTVTIASLTLKQGNSLFVWHVIAMSLGVLVFQPAALHSILARHSFKDPETRKARVMDHKLLQMAVMGSVAVGFLAIFLNKPAGFPGRHFMSVHSLVGLFALALMGWNILDAGYRQGSPFAPKLLWVSWLHRSMGTLAFTCALLAVMLGFFNRTAIVDWAAEPIVFSLPDSWHEMDGWAMNTHGEKATWMFIGATVLLLANMLVPGGARVVPRWRGDLVDKKTSCGGGDIRRRACTCSLDSTKLSLAVRQRPHGTMAHGISTANMSFPRWGGESQWVGA